MGLDLANLSAANGPARLRDDLATIATTAEDVGFDLIAVMDHPFPLPSGDRGEHETLEAYATLGFLAAHTRRVRLLTLVTAVTHRQPGLLAKQVTTVDVLSGGRAMLGIGAGWPVPDSTASAGSEAPGAEASGSDSPSLAERFERLEETLRVCLRMWSDVDGPYDGKHHRLARTVNAPQALSKPHPPILVGGGGEKKTLRLVAKYGQACNLPAGPELPHKLSVLRAHCAREGTNYGAIEKTVGLRVTEDMDDARRQLAQLAGHGVDTVFCAVEPEQGDIRSMVERFGAELTSYAADLPTTRR